MCGKTLNHCTAKDLEGRGPGEGVEMLCCSRCFAARRKSKSGRNGEHSVRKIDRSLSRLTFGVLVKIYCIFVCVCVSLLLKALNLNKHNHGDTECHTIAKCLPSDKMLGEIIA